MVSVTANKKSPESLALASARSKLQTDLIKLRAMQFSLFPALQSVITSVDPTFPEKESLYLPSSFSESFRMAYGLNELGKIEYQLREGRAHDALQSIRTSIKTFNHNLDLKKTAVFGQHANTRAQGFLKQLAADKVSGAEKYRRMRAALIALGLPQNDTVLQQLDDDQLWGKDTSHMSQLGDSKRQDPWFWSVGRPSNLSPAEDLEWSIERRCQHFYQICNAKALAVDRVKWYRERSARNRSREEKEILEEEMKRTLRTFGFLHNMWSTLGESARIPGDASYAHKQAAMFSQFEFNCQKVCDKAAKKRNEHAQWWVFNYLGLMCSIKTYFRRFFDKFKASVGKQS